MKRPTVASLKKVTPENLARLGAERLAEILAAAAQTKPELKRRLRMELAAEQGADHLVLEIDKRLGSLETSRSKVSWRQRPTFIRDLDDVRSLIVGPLARADRTMALGRLFLFMDVARRVSGRVRDKHGDMAAVFDRAANDIGGMLGEADAEAAAAGLVESIVRSPHDWGRWLGKALETAPPGLAALALANIAERSGATGGWMPVIRQLADAAGDIDAYQATYPPAALKTPEVAAEIAQRLLAAHRVDEAGRLLQAAAPVEKRSPFNRGVEPDFDWETAWIDYLERSGRTEEAQAVRWSSFERTLSADRARAFTTRLTGFDDVEAEERAFDHAAGHADVRRGLRFLMEWPALPAAAAMIQARADEIQAAPEEAELWAAKLRARQPAAAELLLRKAAAAAFRNRDYATSTRLTAEADAITG